MDHHPYEEPPQPSIAEFVTFRYPYSALPDVVVWLTSFDMGRGSEWRIRTYATDITTTGFKICINTWGSTILLSAAVSWVAYPAGKAGVSSGRISTNDMRPMLTPQPYNSGYVKFRDGAFPRDITPRVLIAINSLDIKSNGGLRLETKASSISAAGMTWHLNSWADTTLYFAAANYIAL